MLLKVFFGFLFGYCFSVYSFMKYLNTWLISVRGEWELFRVNSLVFGICMFYLLLCGELNLILIKKSLRQIKFESPVYFACASGHENLPRVLHVLRNSLRKQLHATHVLLASQFFFSFFFCCCLMCNLERLFSDRIRFFHSKLHEFPYIHTYNKK